MTSRSSGPDMITIVDKKKTCKEEQWKGRGKSESGYKEAIFSSHFSNRKIIFYEFQFEKKNQSPYPRNFLKASFILLRIVWQI